MVKKSKELKTRVSEDLYAKVQIAAEREGCNTSEFVRRKLSDLSGIDRNDLQTFRSNGSQLNKILNFKVTEEQKDLVKFAAKLEERSVGSFVRKAIKEYLQEMLLVFDEE